MSRFTQFAQKRNGLSHEAHTPETADDEADMAQAHRHHCNARLCDGLLLVDCVAMGNYQRRANLGAGGHIPYLGGNMDRTFKTTSHLDGDGKVARVTGLEPATSGVTGRHSNQLSYTRWRDGGRLGEGPIPVNTSFATL